MEICSIKIYWTGNSNEQYAIVNANNNDTVIFLIISSTTAVEAAASLLLKIKFWPEMKTKEKRDNNSKSNEKKTKTNILKKLHNPWKHKNGTNTLIKLITLMEETGRHSFIRTRASDLVFWNLRVTGILSLNKKWYH